MEIDLGKPRTERLIRIKNGQIGLYRSKGFWVAQGSPSRGEVVRKFFSVKKLGEDEARHAASVERSRMEKQYYGGRLLEN